MASNIARGINSRTGVSLQRIDAVIRLIDEGAPIPFIARYRKGATGNLDERQLREIALHYRTAQQIEARRREMLEAIEAQGALTPELAARLEQCDVAEELEDLFLPFRAKRQSKANLARRRGLDELADYIEQQKGPTRVEDIAMGYLSYERKVLTVAEAIEGALLILADRIAQDTGYRKWLRNLMFVEGEIRSRAVKSRKGRPGKYAAYDNFSEKVSRIPSHRMLAVRRGTREKFLTFSIEIDDVQARAELRSRVALHAIRPSAELIRSAIDDAYERLLRPVIESEVRNILKERAESEAVMVFEENLSALLLAPPAGGIRIMGIDPVGKGRSKLAAVDENGGLVEHHSMRLSESPSKPSRNGDPKATRKQGSEAPAQPKAPAEPVASAPSPAAADASREEAAPPDAVHPDSGQTESQATSEAGSGSGPAPSSVGDSTAQGDTASSGTPAEAQATDAPQTAAGPEGDPTSASTTETPPVVETSQAPVEAAPVEKTVEKTVETTPGDALPAGAASETDVAGTDDPVQVGEHPTPGTEPRQAPETPQPAPNPGEALVEILQRTGVKGIVVGSGAGSRPVEKFVRNVIRDHGLDVFVFVANEVPAGAYATSERGAAEFADLDVPTRSAVSIARRLQDPLAEMVKVEPRSIGVGQYQHDVDAPKLEASVEAAMETAVNCVGANLNSASEDLLRWISGLGPETARAIVEYREANGPFTTREQLRSVPGIDERAFTYAAGFLRVSQGSEPLDESAIHPESYELVRKLAEAAAATVPQLLGNGQRLRAVPFAEFEEAAGKFTLDEIRNELYKPGRDVRKAFAVPHIDDRVREIDDLEEGMKLEGTVTNVTNFGAFVDIGVGQDGLVHISELSHRYVADARRAVQIGDVVKVKVIGVERAQKRISLSVKAATPRPEPPRRNRPRPERRPGQEAARSDGPAQGRGGPSRERGRDRGGAPGPDGGDGPRRGPGRGSGQGRGAESRESGANGHGRDRSRTTRTRSKAPVGAGERGSRPSSSRPFRDTEPKQRHESISHLSMDEQIRRLREKFKGPDEDTPRKN